MSILSYFLNDVYFSVDELFTVLIDIHFNFSLSCKSIVYNFIQSYAFPYLMGFFISLFI